MVLVRNSVLLSSCALVALAVPASAQDAFDDNVILVTAQNRTQNVQDVPIAINVVSAEEVGRAGVTDFEAVSRVAPVLQITRDANATRVAMRGIGTNSNDETQDQSISISIDGEYLNRPTVLNTSIFDLDRVEVLRGPQGTLYGRTATGGAVNFITRKPGFDFSANGSVSYGNYDQIIVEGGIDVPLASTLAVRLSGLYNENKGYNRHTNTPDRSQSKDVIAGRLSLRFEPTSEFAVNLAVEYAEDRSVPASRPFVDFNSPGFRADETAPGTCSAQGWEEVAPLVPGVQCVPTGTNWLAAIDRHFHRGSLSGVGFMELDTFAVRGEVSYDMGPATITYKGGYRDSKQIADTPFSLTFVFRNFQDDVQTHSHELLLNGQSGPVIWQVGSFFFNEQLQISRGLFNPAVGPNGSYQNFFRRPEVESKSWAVFGQTEIELTETLSALVGARYTDDQRSGIFENFGFRFNSGPNEITVPAAPGQQLNLSAEASKFTWLAGLNLKPNPDTLVYAKVSTGFKPGGFDSVGTYAPETTTAYEAGLKLNFGDSGQHVFNTAAFYYDYRDLQVPVLVDTTLGNQIFNAGKATIWGIEAETSLRVGSGGTFRGSVNYLNAVYDELLVSLPVQCVPSNCPVTAVGDLDPNTPGVQQPNIAGNTPPRSPDFIITIGYEQVIELPNEASITAAVNTRYTTSFFNDIFNFNDSRQSAFTKTDLTLEYRPASGTWNVQAFVRNIENKREVVRAAYNPAGPTDTFGWEFGTPRLYGVRLGFDF